MKVKIIISTIGLLLTYINAFSQFYNTLPDSGNVGIGVTTPMEKFEVSGNSLLHGNLTLNGNIIINGLLRSNNYGLTKMRSDTVITGRIISTDSIVRFGENTILIDYSNNRIAWDIEKIGGLGIGNPLGTSGPMGLGLNSIAMGYGVLRAKATNSIAIGNDFQFLEGPGSIALGTSLKTTTAAEKSVVIGGGYDLNNPLVNTYPRSLMIGFNSNLPTIFVEPASGVNKIGRVGIGTTQPLAALNVYNGVIQIDGTTDYWTSNSWKPRIQTPVNSAWITTNTIAGDNRFMGIGMTNSGWYFILSKSGPGNDDEPAKYPFYVGVDGKLTAREIEVQLNDWPDYVFDDNYKLSPISHIAKFIKENKHLPGVPSADEISKNGLLLGEMNGVLLKKIEEQMLYIIELESQLKQMNDRIEKIEKAK